MKQALHFTKFEVYVFGKGNKINSCMDILQKLIHTYPIIGKTKAYLDIIQCQSIKTLSGNNTCVISDNNMNNY